MSDCDRSNEKKIYVIVNRNGSWVESVDNLTDAFDICDDKTKYGSNPPYTVRELGEPIPCPEPVDHLILFRDKKKSQSGPWSVRHYSSLMTKTEAEAVLDQLTSQKRDYCYKIVKIVEVDQ